MKGLFNYYWFKITTIRWSHS